MDPTVQARRTGEVEGGRKRREIGESAFVSVQVDADDVRAGVTRAQEFLDERQRIRSTIRSAGGDGVAAEADDQSNLQRRYPTRILNGSEDLRDRQVARPARQAGGHGWLRVDDVLRGEVVEAFDSNAVPVLGRAQAGAQDGVDLSQESRKIAERPIRGRPTRAGERRVGVMLRGELGDGFGPQGAFEMQVELDQRSRIHGSTCTGQIPRGAGPRYGTELNSAAFIGRPPTRWSAAQPAYGVVS